MVILIGVVLRNIFGWFATAIEVIRPLNIINGTIAAVESFNGNREWRGRAWNHDWGLQVRRRDRL